MFFAEEDNRGNLILDESGREIFSKYVIGAELHFIPCGSVALDEDVRRFRNSARGTKGPINSSEPTRDEVEGSHHRRCTAGLKLLIASKYIHANGEKYKKLVKKVIA